MTLPDSWRKVSLIDVCELNPRLSPADRPNPEKTVSLFSYDNFEKSDGEQIKYESQPFHQMPKTAVLFRAKDVLIATRGSRVMNCIFVEELPTEFGVAQHCLVLRHSEELNPEYLLYFVKQPSFKQAARRTNRGTSHQLAIPTQFFRDMYLPLPPLREQNALVELFKKSSLAPYHLALAQARNLSTQLAQTLLLSSEEAGSWPIYSLADVCKLGPHKVVSQEDTSGTVVNFYSSSGVNRLTRTVTPERTALRVLPKLSFQVLEGDVLFGSRAGASNSGNTCFIPGDAESRHYASRAFQVLRPTPSILPQYLACFMRLPWLLLQIETFGNNIGRLSHSLLRRIEFPLPSIDRQREILLIMDQVPISSIHSALDMAALLSRAIFREGFTGELSSRWREAFAQMSEVTSAVKAQFSNPQIVASELYAPEWRTSRRLIIERLSAVQLDVWKQLCEQRHPLVIGDPAAFASFCFAVQAQSNISQIAVRRALHQLAALGLIRHMSIPNAHGQFMAAYRRCRVVDSGRAGEDTAYIDALNIRHNLSTQDKAI
jgi:type I restriction enzyme S subunit